MKKKVYIYFEQIASPGRAVEAGRGNAGMRIHFELEDKYINVWN